MSCFSVGRGSSILAGLVVLYAVATTSSFEIFHIWVNVVTPEATMLLVLAGTVAFRVPVERAMGRAVRVQRSREQLVASREEERRRLRRDLHDGLGPTLATVLLDLSAARRLLGRESTADRVLAEAREGVQNALADVRRLVYDLRPPALDQLGLVGAIRQTATGLEHDSLLISVLAPEEIPPLPAAVEVAMFRIAQEAMTNVVRHAQAHHCTVLLSVADEVEIEIIDDGTGIPGRHQAGVGIASMRERAAELGGSFLITNRSEGGTCVSARFPLGTA
jgi:signal transduction histidine kinase